MTFEQFIEEHNLKWDIQYFHPDQFSARFEDGSIKDEGVLIYEYGSGNTARKAIKDYAKIIAGKTLVIDRVGCSRQTICVPNTWSRKLKKT